MPTWVGAQSQRRRLSPQTVQHPRVPPKQISQSKITQTFCFLTSIPLSNACHNIKHLYLSHNQLKSLQGIQHYPALESLNVSYNYLSDIRELGLLVYKRNMRRVGLKLNDFVFGYQDFVVGLLPSLKRIDDLEVGNEEEKKRVNRIATIIGDQMLLWMKMMAKIKERLIVTLNGSPNKELIDMPSQMIQMINRLSSIYVVPTEENVFKKNINDLLAICLMAVETEDEVSVDDDIDSDLDYLASIRKTFQNVFKRIMLNFSARNDDCLSKYISNYLRDNPECTSIEVFGKLGVLQQSEQFFPRQTQSTIAMSGGGYKFNDTLKHNPGRYMEKLDVTKMKHHPLNHYVTHVQDRQAMTGENKWTQLMQYGQTIMQYGQTKRSSESDSCFERIPMFVYEKRYLEVVTQMVLQEIGSVLNIYHKVELKCQQDNQLAHKEKQLSMELAGKTIKKNDSLLSFGNSKNQVDDIIPFEIQKSVVINTNPENDDDSQRSTLQKKPQFQKKYKEKHISAQAIYKYQLYDINIAYKVFRSFKKCVAERRTAFRLEKQGEIQ